MGGKVVHALGQTPYDVYVGRRNKRHRLPESVFGNPYRIGEHGDREEVLRRYEELQRNNLHHANAYPSNYLLQAWKDNIASLRGKTLACWCAPKDRALTVDDETVCHGQILLRLAEEVS